MTTKMLRRMPVERLRRMSDEGAFAELPFTVLRRYCVDKDGYVQMLVVRDGVLRQMSEHRIVAMALVGGRHLLRSEIVHHKDGNPANNKLDNLQVVTAKEHARIHGVKARFDARGRKFFVKEKKGVKKAVALGAPTRKLSPRSRELMKGLVACLERADVSGLSVSVELEERGSRECLSFRVGKGDGEVTFRRNSEIVRSLKL